MLYGDLDPEVSASSIVVFAINTNTRWKPRKKNNETPNDRVITTVMATTGPSVGARRVRVPMNISYTMGRAFNAYTAIVVMA
mmetsp:Transcript_14125/g.27783  ORF Transcript_14125/g.27783 Transcript_14125/m.27783 type:complete len:82 (-) Transcript_14125:570-815(-)